MNIRDIARLAGVTPGTVSKVLNNYPDISTATRQHVLQIITENQYDSKANVKNAKAAPESTRICLVVEAVYNEVYEWMERNLSKDFHNAGYCIAGFHDNFYIQDKQEKFNELLAYLERDKISGLLYLGGNYAQLGLQLLGAPPGRRRLPLFLPANQPLPLCSGADANAGRCRASRHCNRDFLPQ